MRPFRPGCGTVSTAQLLTLPEIIRIIAPGGGTTRFAALLPASSSATEVLGSSERRLATAQPPEPPPTTTKSNVSVMRIPQTFVVVTPRRHCDEQFQTPSFRDGALAPDPESRDSPMCNRTSEVRCFASPRNDDIRYDMNRSIFSSRAILAP